MYLRKNRISDFNQLDYLKNLKHLKVIYLDDNPISKDKQYWLKVIKKLKNLEILDDKEITQVEKDQANKNTKQEHIPQHIVKNKTNNDNIMSAILLLL